MRYLLRDASLPTLPTDVHIDYPKVMMEYDSFPDDANPSCCRMTSSKSTTITFQIVRIHRKRVIIAILNHCETVDRV